MKNRFTNILFYSLFIICGIAFIIFGISFFKKSIASENWYQAEGIIVSSNVRTNYEENHGKTYSADIEYQYNVGDVSYNSEEVSLGDYSSSNKNHFQKIVDKYYIGKVVIVYYNPEKPSEAVLEPGLTIVPYIVILFGFFPIITSILVFYFSNIRKKIKKIEIVLDKTDYFKGEIIKGKVHLIFNKPVKAETLKVALLGEKIISGGKEGGGNETIFRSEITLDGKREYFDNLYSFEIKIPEDILDRMRNWVDEKVPYEWAKKVTNISQQLGIMKTLDKYSIVVSLEIRNKIDIKNSVEINIT